MLNFKPIIAAITLIICFFGVHNQAVVAQSLTEDSLLIELEETDDAEEKVEILFQLALLHGFVDLDTNCFDMVSSAKLDFLKNPNKSYVGMTKLGLQVEIEQDAVSYLLESLDYFDECECDSLKAEIYLMLARVSIHSSNFLRTQEYLMKGLELVEGGSNSYLLSRYYGFIGVMYILMENFEDGKSYMLKSTNYTDTLIQNRNTAVTYYTLGIIDFYQGNLEKAKMHLKKAMAQKDKLEYKYTEIYITMFLGEIDLDLGQYKSALKYFDEADSMLKNVDSAYTMVYSYQAATLLLDKSEYYHLTGDDKQALALLTKALSISKMKEHYWITGKALNSIGEIYEQQGQYKKAIDFYRDHHLLKDSILNVYNVSKITKLELEYQHLKELNQKRLKRIQMEQEYQNKVRTYQWLVISGILSFIIAVLIFIIYRNKARANARREKLEQEKINAEKEILEKELEFKNKELTTGVMYMLKKNNFIWNLSEKIKQASLILKPESKKIFMSIVKEMDSNMGSDTWEDFEARFKDVHSSFYDKLLKDFPELTPNELKLCAFLKLNMSTKDIATITYQSLNSITVARHRLRTKLGLERDENLITFLAQY